MSDLARCRQLIQQQHQFLQLTAENEQTIDGPIEFELADGTQVALIDTGILRIEPKQSSGIDMVISSGVHGNETAPIEIVDAIARDILNGQLACRNRLLLIIGNPVAMNISQRFKGENLNRLFNGKHGNESHYEAKRAAQLEQQVTDFFESSQSESHKIHYDLHTAIRGSKHKKFAIYPYPDGRDWNKSQLQFLLASDINTILLGHQPSGTFSYFSSHKFKADAFTIELGQVKPFGENDMAEFSAIDANLRTLIRGEEVETQAFDNSDFNLFKVKDEILKQAEQGFSLNIADDLQNFSTFNKGYQLTNDAGGGYLIKADGDAIVFPNAKVPVGQRVGLIVAKTTV